MVYIPKNSEFLIDDTKKTILLKNVNANTGGGKITISDIDELQKYPSADTVEIMGLHQDTFEYFIHKYGNQLKRIDFFKNKLIEDLSLLGSLPNLEYLDFYYNQRVTQLWDMSGNISLKGLMISNFKKLKSIKNIETAPRLECLQIDSSIHPTMVIDSLKRLSNTDIRTLKFYGMKIEDEDFSFVTEMKKLETFDFGCNLLPTEKVAWIVANKPDIQGFSLCAMQEFMSYNEQTDRCDKQGVFVVGKRKPTLFRGENDERIEKYKKNFDILVDKYRDVPYAKAFPAIYID
jgi:hypothetical protein